MSKMSQLSAWLEEQEILSHFVVDPEAVARSKALAQAREDEWDHFKAVADQKVTPEMTDRQMLHILQARQQVLPYWYGMVERSGGPSTRRLIGYIAGALAGYAMRVDPRVRAILLAVDNGGKPNTKLGPLPPQPPQYMPGEPPPWRRRRAAREAKAAREAAGDVEG
ncbi:hypothetical protein [Methylobacterium fujisawaense]|uniref:hypothetical protein n=1 Tax=Methylobacterium fujisawaense TaxID=107400 RepID=UPI0037012DB9